MTDQRTLDRLIAPGPPLVRRPRPAELPNDLSPAHMTLDTNTRTTVGRALTDELFERYVSWRNESNAVQHSYEAWVSSDGPDRDLAYAGLPGRSGPGGARGGGIPRPARVDPDALREYAFVRALGGKSGCSAGEWERDLGGGDRARC